MNALRRIAATTSLALAAAGLGVVAQPATAAEDSALTWSFSDYLFNANKLPVGFTSHTVSGGATDTTSGIVFGGGQGTGSLETGDLHVAYDGSVTFTWHVDITFSDPEIVVQDGVGEIVADVSWAIPDAGSAADVVLTTFDPATTSVDGDDLTATPDWSSGSWSSELIAALPDSVDAFFKATGSSSDARKAPATFTAAVPAEDDPEEGTDPSVDVTTTYDENTVLFDVSGTGFTAVTEPGDAGVYVGLAPSGGLPDVSSQGDMEKFAAYEWVTPAQLADGSFMVSLDPENQYLDPRASYSVYTWQAHTHSNPSQDTETPVTIDFSRIGWAAKLKVVKKSKALKVTVGTAGTAVGKVAVKLTKGKVAKSASATVKAGKAKVKLPKLANGKWKAVVNYSPSTAAYRAATKTVTFKIR